VKVELASDPESECIDERLSVSARRARQTPRVKS
jgi:hypothetical protein